jgi:hypothetical protein
VEAIMFVHAGNSNGKEYRLFNAETWREIPFAVWANDETGEYCFYASKDGRIIVDPMTGDTAERRMKGNIKLVHITELSTIPNPTTRWLERWRR